MEVAWGTSTMRVAARGDLTKIATRIAFDANAVRYFHFI
jgi:hypothetical protein